MSNEPIRVLVVDDEPIILRAFKHILESREYFVDTASDLSAARNLVAQNVYALIITDFGLPDGDGESLMRDVQMRSLATSFILISGENRPVEALPQPACGARCCMLVKPVDKERLLQTVDQMLARVPA